MATFALAWRVLCALIAHKPAHGHGHAHGGKVKNNDFLLELRHKGGCCCFGWAVYGPWVCYVGIWALYNPKPPKCALTCRNDLTADQTMVSAGVYAKVDLVVFSVWAGVSLSLSLGLSLSRSLCFCSVLVFGFWFFFFFVDGGAGAGAGADADADADAGAGAGAGADAGAGKCDLPCLSSFLPPLAFTPHHAPS